MNTNVILEDNKKSLDLSEIVNEDWPMVRELAVKKYNINPKVPKKVDAESIVNQDLNGEQKPEVAVVSTEISQPNLAAIESPASQSINNFLDKKKSVSQTEEADVNMKSIFIGLVNLFANRAATLLKPINFMYDNFSNVFLAFVHLVVPAVMTYYLTTEVATVASQLAKEPIGMYVVYTAVFYFACTFTWIVMQVFLSGVLGMFKTAGKEVIRAGHK